MYKNQLNNWDDKTKKDDSSKYHEVLESLKKNNERPELQKFVSFPFALFMLAIFVYAIIVATSWTQEGGRIVKAFAYPGAVVCGVMVIMDFRELGSRP